MDVHITRRWSYRLTDGTWPDIPRKYATQTIRPDEIAIKIRQADSGEMKVERLSIAGHVVKKDGTAGAVHAVEEWPWYDRCPYEWLNQIVAECLAKASAEAKMIEGA